MYQDNLGVAYALQQSGNKVTAVVVDAPPKRRPGWVNATGTLSSNEMSLNMTFFYPQGKTDVVDADVEWGCATLSWRNGARWQRPDESLKTLHLVFMTHLDVGFTNGARNVCDLYFDDHFPKAINTSRALRAAGGPARFVYTEFPWLINEYLNSSAGCAHRPRTPMEIELLGEAIELGDVSWHAHSLNILTELYDKDIFDWSLSLRDKLNSRFGKKNGVLCAKQTDVPGFSRSVIPYLAKHNISALHIGYNAACKVPTVPPVFRWQHPETQTEIIVMVEPTYGDFVRVESFPDTALAFMYTSDNNEPPNSTQVTLFWDNLRFRYPNAQIVASSLDAYAEVLVDNREKLPAVTEELGDSWIYGAPADPYRLAAFRHARRSLQEAISNGTLAENNTDVFNYLCRLMKPPEHNWGLSVGQYLPGLRSKSSGNWSNVLFHAVKSRADYLRMEEEWREQRLFCFPENFLPGEEKEVHFDNQWELFASQLSKELQDLASPRLPSKQNTLTWIPASAQNQFQCGDFRVSFDENNGAITELTDMRTKRSVVDPDHVLGLFRYKTYSLDDFNKFNREYNPHCGPPCGDFSKQGMDSADPLSGDWMPLLKQLLATSDGCNFVAQLELDSDAHVLYGAPAVIEVQFAINSSPDEDEPVIQVELVWQNKTATRLAEAMFMSFQPNVPNPSNWTMDVLGFPVSPLQVVANGTRHIHAVWDGVNYSDGKTNVTIRTIDVPLVSPGDTDHLLWYDGQNLPDLSGGWHFNVYNNLWGTAFPQWYGDDGRARFEIYF